MDMFFILEHSVCCYRYSPNLRARTHFVNDHRLRPDKWTDEDYKKYRRKCSAEFGRNSSIRNFYVKVMNEHLAEAEEQGKTLLVIDYSSGVAIALEEILKEARLRGEPKQWLVISFFHSDEVMQDLQYSCPVEDLIKDKIYWLEDMMPYSFIKTIEIEYNKTLHEDYLQEIFEEHIPTSTL